MKYSNLKQNNKNNVKTHKEILSILEIIKQFEQRYPPFEIEEPKVEKELIEVEEKPEEFIPLIEPRLPTTPTVFRLRYTEEGNLENIDLKKPKPKKEYHIRLKKPKTEEKVVKKKSGGSEKTSKKSKLKDGIGKIRKLKKVIPSRSKKEE